jgi:nicotinate-nucleotide--dimethylbenzimidazole phosphoribosyltransferase
MNEEILQILSSAPEPDMSAAEAVSLRASQVLRPTGALQRLDRLAAWLAGWQKTRFPQINRPAAVVFVADHGVAEEWISAYPSDVTAAMLKALNEEVATANAMAKALGARLQTVDVGVGRPTGNIVTAAALTPERFSECIEIGRRVVANTDADVLVLGEMGIGNTTVASALTSSLLGCRAAECTGRGTGIDDVTYARKISVVEAACRRLGDVSPLEALRQLGGAELAAIAGATLEARMRSIPVVLDGFVVTASVLPLELAHPGALDHCVAGHLSPEPGHRLLLERLGKHPILDLELRLGEGTGGLLAIPILALAAAAVTDVATFEEWGLERR